MTATGIELALGTVQFGTAYGIAGRGEAVPEHEVREILARAWEAGIRVLDTAAGYGDIEQRLGALAGEYPFTVVSKVPALPIDADEKTVAELTGASIARSIERLGPRLKAILFHRGEDLLGGNGEVAWRAARAAIGEADIGIGASCYSPEEAIAIHQRFAIPVVQLPGNALDRRIAQPAAVLQLRRLEIHLRSVFLQGLLLMPAERAVLRVPRSAAALSAWRRWCSERGIDPLQAALGVAKGLPGVRYCLVGVDRLSQLEQIIDAWQAAQPLDSAEIASNDVDVIDPRSWRTA
jgi:aryl-alcohol dehydrogenase-like predicted oxidoreductase